MIDFPFTSAFAVLPHGEPSGALPAYAGPFPEDVAEARNRKPTRGVA